MTAKRGPFTINLVRKGSREEAEALLQVLPDSPVSPAEALEVSLVVEAHSREDRSPSHPAPGLGTEADSIHRIQKGSLSEYSSGSCRVTKGSKPIPGSFLLVSADWEEWVAWVVWVGPEPGERQYSTMTMIRDRSPAQAACREVCQAVDQVPADARHGHPPSLHNQAKSRNPS